MPWEVLHWLVAFLLQSALLGCCMYQLIQLSDLEADFLNPHDAARNINRVVLPEYGAQAALTVLLLGTGRWFYGGVHAVLLAYHARQYLRRQHLADVTEIFRQVGERKQRETLKMVFYLLTFIVAIYKFIEVVVVAFLTPAGRKAAAKVLRDAAAAMQRR
ncbi:cornichon-like protein 1 [Micractinium conductrix]|uniref:Cornichon-like protein 1 n=1 Tax=Micractinium conductrix TaxID=554055 RepID=A0A2P6VG97_9CHLO|nr:cornichon-like protein 1 [Micractinium conductrix]|eukprot:PSC73122.1 cornichon-like protein 1 [Micractinium conductrix]